MSGRPGIIEGQAAHPGTILRVTNNSILPQRSLPVLWLPPRIRRSRVAEAVGAAAVDAGAGLQAGKHYLVSGPSWGLE